MSAIDLGIVLQGLQNARHETLMAWCPSLAGTAPAETADHLMNALLDVELAIVAIEQHEPDGHVPVESADDPELTDEQIDKLVVKLAARVKSNGGKSEIAEMVGALASKARRP